jgi:hypothetical protein
MEQVLPEEDSGEGNWSGEAKGSDTASQARKAVYQAGLWLNSRCVDEFPV